VNRVNLGWRHRLSTVLQSEAAECGLACLAMIAGFFGRLSNLGDLRRQFGVSLKGATLQDLVRIADQLSFASRPVRLELDELRLLKTPCILHWDLNHFVVLKSVGRHGIVIHDPGVGVRRLPLSEVSKHFSGVALELTPTGGFQPAQAAPRVRLRGLDCPRPVLNNGLPADLYGPVCERSPEPVTAVVLAAQIAVVPDANADGTRHNAVLQESG